MSTKSPVYCPLCGDPMARGATRCLACFRSKPSPAPSKFCPRCQKEKADSRSVYCGNCRKAIRSDRWRCGCGNPMAAETGLCQPCIDKKVEKSLHAIGRPRKDGRVYLQFAVEPSLKRRFLQMSHEVGMSATDLFRTFVDEQDSELGSLDPKTQALVHQLAEYHDMRPRALIRELIENERDRLGKWFDNRKELGLVEEP